MSTYVHVGKLRPQRLFVPDPKHHFNPRESPPDFLLAGFYSSPTDPDAALSDPLTVALIPSLRSLGFTLTTDLTPSC
jgi:hypothetical protein